MILSIPQVINALQALSQTETVARAGSLTLRIVGFTLQYFREIKQGWNFGCGSKDIVKAIRTASGKWHPAELDARVNRAYWGMAGGATVVLGAGCGLISSPLKGSTSSWDATFFRIGDGFFMLASLIRIRNCMADFVFSQDHGDYFGMQNAALGVIASVSALLASLLLMTSCPMYFWCFFCFLSAAFSIMQFLQNMYYGKYNFLFYSQQQYLPI